MHLFRPALGFGKTPTSIRCGDDLTRSTNEELIASKADSKPNSNENLTTCNGVGKLIESLPPGQLVTIFFTLLHTFLTTQVEHLQLWFCVVSLFK